MDLFGMPVSGFWLPFIGRRRIYLNRDLSTVDTGEFDILDERGPLYVEPIVFEWLCFGFGLTGAIPHDTITGQPVPIPA